MAGVVSFLMIFVPVWIVVRIGALLVGFVQGLWWGIAIPDDRELLRKIFDPSGVSPTGLALIISGILWFFIG
jgi:hypothetical protein